MANGDERYFEPESTYLCYNFEDEHWSRNTSVQGYHHSQTAQPLDRDGGTDEPCDVRALQEQTQCLEEEVKRLEEEVRRKGEEMKKVEQELRRMQEAKRMVDDGKKREEARKKDSILGLEPFTMLGMKGEELRKKEDEIRRKVKEHTEKTAEPEQEALREIEYRERALAAREEELKKREDETRKLRQDAQWFEEEFDEFEPDDEWKHQMKREIYKGLELMVKDFKEFEVSLGKKVLTEETRFRSEQDIGHILVHTKAMAKLVYLIEVKWERCQRRCTAGNQEETGYEYRDRDRESIGGEPVLNIHK